MLDPLTMAAGDPLGPEGLLMDTFRLASSPAVPSDLLAIVLEAAATDVEAYAGLHETAQPSADRLAFRELGLVIGTYVDALRVLAQSGQRRSWITAIASSNTMSTTM